MNFLSSGGCALLAGATLDIRANIGVEAIRVSGTGVGGNGALVASTGTGTTAGAITLMADTSIGGDGTLNVNGAVSGAVNQNNLTKVGTGTTNFGVGGSLADIGNFTANAGTTNINSAVGSGTSAVSVGPTTAATLKFGSVSQTLSSLTIGNGSTVTLTSGLAALADEAAFAEQGGVLTVSAVAVPEPGLISLLLAGALGLAARRRA